ncbi:hypothetical protein HK097_001258 [Rhizophlyctis rosea]|uniref:Uncharacterized protein n=1 Tax=Rhizophlyctis rosea TaxID=64517 RepID=A0AAD5S7F6_9FUNG|nr:hypothetical protein HK097_001258 [Rhizophlyctis rosea]
MRNLLEYATVLLSATNIFTVTPDEKPSNLLLRRQSTSNNAACDALVDAWTQAEWSGCQMPKKPITTEQELWESTDNLIIQKCSNPACYDVDKPFRPRLNSTCSKSYNANVRTPFAPSQNMSIPVSSLYPPIYPNGTELDMRTSFNCVKDPSGTQFCYSQFVRSVAQVQVKGSSMKDEDKKKALCNSCVWRVLDGAKGNTARKNRTMDIGGSSVVFPELNEELDPADVYPKYSGMVNSVCGSDWLSTAANGQAAFQSFGAATRMATAVSWTWIVVGAVGVGALSM